MKQQALGVHWQSETRSASAIARLDNLPMRQRTSSSSALRVGMKSAGVGSPSGSPEPFARDVN
jgi:hypothetical protein